MRNDWLLFFHVLSAMVLLGSALTVTIALLSAAGRLDDVSRTTVLWRVAYRLNLLLTVPSTVVALAFGEVLKSKESATGTWLDISSGLAYVAVLVGALMLHGFLRRGIAAAAVGVAPSASTVRGAASIAPAIVTAILLIAFLMTGKPV